MTDIENNIANIEMAVLKTLNECSDHSDYGQAFYTWKIAEDSGITKEYARVALLSLRNRGLVIWQSGLFNDEGKTAGSGYAITNQGQKYLALADEIMVKAMGEVPVGWGEACYLKWRKVFTLP